VKRNIPVTNGNELSLAVENMEKGKRQERNKERPALRPT
jgi:hypothetical protein